jgi:hypothetical protein
MKAHHPGEIIHMSYITTNTVKDGKVAILIAVDNYSQYCFGVAIEQEMQKEAVEKHLSGIMKEVHKHHPKRKPLFIMAYGKEWMHSFERQYKGKATFQFNPVLADAIAMPVAKLLLQNLLNK